MTDAWRARLEAGGLDGLTVDELRAEDLPGMLWAGSAAHLRSVARQLERARSGEVEYLVARAPDGTPVAKAGIDYSVQIRTGVIWQVATHPEVQGRGIGTRLLREAEARIRRRGCRRVGLSVEVDNPRARALYERLGYRPVGTRVTGWEVDEPDGAVGWHSTEVLDMEKPIVADPPVS